MDRTDITLCILLLGNSRTPYQELANKLGLSVNAVHKRIKALADARIIRAFTARLSLLALEVVTVWIFGRSTANSSDLHTRLRKHRSIYWVVYSGGGYMYVGGYLRELSELEGYVDFVKREAQMEDPIVGIMPIPPHRSFEGKLYALDYQILKALHKDSRKPASAVAVEVHASARTVQRRLDRMVKKSLAELSIEWYPDASNDIISLCHINLTARAERAKVEAFLRQACSTNILYCLVFSNLPRQLILCLWTNTFRELEDIRERIRSAEGIGSILLNVLQIGYIFDTWRDDVIFEKSRVVATSAT